jgi:urocanate hydratase
MTASAAINESAKASPLEVFRARAEAKAVLIANGYLDLQTAVDELWQSAETAGLVKALGADELQWILSEAFARWRPCDDG